MKICTVIRFFCQFVTFDLLFTSLTWLICVMMRGETLEQIMNTEILEYNVKTSLLDLVMVAICRSVALLLFYMVLYLNNWSIVAVRNIYGTHSDDNPVSKETSGGVKVGEGGEEIPPKEVAAEVLEKEEVVDSDVEVKGEESTPAEGLFVPGLHTPANELAKAYGVAFFFPKRVNELAETIETKFLPPHVLVIFPIERRYDVLEVVNNYYYEILNMGIFVGEDPFKAEHIAYTIKQYDKIIRPRSYDRLALMVSTKSSMPILQLASCKPVYISSDVVAGERECLAMFPVGYGDDYVEEESIKEEEQIVELPQEAVEEVIKHLLTLLAYGRGFVCVQVGNDTTGTYYWDS